MSGSANAGNIGYYEKEKALCNALSVSDLNANYFSNDSYNNALNFNSMEVGSNLNSKGFFSFSSSLPKNKPHLLN